MTKEEIALTLKNLRLQTGKTQKEIAQLIGRSQPIVGHWESGYAQPDINMLLMLCDIYGTTLDAMFGLKNKDKILSKDDEQLLEKYHGLSLESRNRFTSMLDHELDLIKQISDKDTLLAQQAKYITTVLSNANKSNAFKIRAVPYYDRLASAGTGQIIWDDLVVGDMDIPDNEKTKYGDLALGVNGDSMEPIYWDIDTVLVQKTQELNIGDIGVFILDGECLIKELGYRRLISKNPDYPPILINENSNLICAGKVVCNLTEHPNEQIEDMYERRRRSSQNQGAIVCENLI